MNNSSQQRKSDKKAKLKAWRDGERIKAQNLFPLADSRLQEFFGMLEKLRAKHGCFHDIRHALQVIQTMQIAKEDADGLLDWCNQHGGYCDCEIAANTFMHWHENRVQT